MQSIPYEFICKEYIPGASCHCDVLDSEGNYDTVGEVNPDPNACPETGGMVCSRCYTGYKLVNGNTCEPYQCLCSNGTPYQNDGNIAHCQSDTHNMCESCDPGFYN